MKFKLPNPLHGWRDFAGEVGIIVLGVLIALAADQLVDDWHSRNELGEFRSALAREASYNLGAYEYRLNQSRCVDRRLAELREWQEQKTDKGLGRPSAPIGRPTNLSILTSVWDARTGDIVGEMPLEERLSYSRLYDSLRNFADVVQSEREVWRSLAEFEAASALDVDRQMRLHGLIVRADNLNHIVQLNAQRTMRLADPLGIRPSHEPDEILPFDNLCKAIF